MRRGRCRWRMCWPFPKLRKMSSSLATPNNWSSRSRAVIPTVPLFPLEHLLAGAKTISPDKGLFLERTWRLHPKLCEFTSEVFYEGRLFSREGLENQRIEGHPWLGDHGLWFVPVFHEGNQNTSEEEVDVVVRLVDSLVQPGVN